MSPSALSWRGVSLIHSARTVHTLDILQCACIQGQSLSLTVHAQCIHSPVCMHSGRSLSRALCAVKVGARQGIRMHTYPCTHTHVHIPMHTYPCIHTVAYIPMHAHRCVRTHACVRTLTRMRIRTHAYVHMRMRMRAGRCPVAEHALKGRQQLLRAKVHMRTCTCVLTHHVTHMHIPTHTYTCICVRAYAYVRMRPKDGSSFCEPSEVASIEAGASRE